MADVSQQQTHTQKAVDEEQIEAEAVADASQHQTHTADAVDDKQIAAEAVADASQQQTHTVTAASDDADVDVADDTSPAGGLAQQQGAKGGEPDDAEEMQLDSKDGRHIIAGDDTGQVWDFGGAPLLLCHCNTVVG